MIVRCGSCKTQFDVPGPGRFGCPACGLVNVVRAAGDPTRPGASPGGPPAGGMPGGAPAAPPPPPPAPSPRVSCPECEFSFIVGKIAKASCPNCGFEVPTGYEEPNG